MELTKEINKNIFREYDIRGVAGTDLTEDVAYTIGRAYGSYIQDLRQNTCVIGYDNRNSSVMLSDALINGITASGVDVIKLGLVTTPMYYYACIKLNIECGIMVTASHNPKDDNGFKIAFNKNGNAKGKEIQDFYEFVMNQKFKRGFGTVKNINIKDDYIKYLLSSVNINKDLKVVIDCGNGTTATIIQDILDKLPCDTVLIYGISDGNFPNHHPDPSVDENMRVLSNTVKQFNYDLGISFDGDGDRVGIVDNLGRIVRIDQFMSLIVKDLSKKYENKKFLYDVKCGLSLIKTIEQNNCEGFMVRTGNSYTKTYTKDYDCIFGGEYSGHVYFRDKFLGFDSGIYAGLRAIELVGESNKKLSEMVDELPKYYSTPEIKIKSNDELKFEVIKKIKDYAISKNYKFNEIDGIRIEMFESWVSVRASNTGPNITFRAESNLLEKCEELQKEFLKVINDINVIESK